MFKKEVLNIIKKNVLKDIKAYSIKPKEYNDFINKRLEYEINKNSISENNFDKVVIYDDYYDINDNFSIVYEDFVGKNEKLNINNSYENPEFYNYISNNKIKNINYIYKKTLYSIIYDYNTIFLFNKKHIIKSLINLILTSISLFLKILFLFFAGIFNFLIFILFKILKKILKLKYKFNKNILFSFLSESLKFIINIINNFFMLFNKFFINSFEVVINSSKIFMINDIYNSITDKVDRYDKNIYHKDLISKIRNNRLEYLRELVMSSKKYINDMVFLKISLKISNSSNINSPVLKKYFLTLENLQKINIKNDIVIDKLGKRVKKNKDKGVKFINRIRSINSALLKIVNKDKKLYSSLIKKINNIEKGIQI